MGGSTKHPVTTTVPELATAPDPDPRPAVPDPATVPESAPINQAVHDIFSGAVAHSAHDHLNPKPPDIQHIKSKETVAELAVNKSLSKSAQKKAGKAMTPWPVNG
ncbi:hypothetical protein RHGRI_038535 [Rhododendron griersonianum]|uniref:Uncharacterized protein n=1 Tax=Rhododendron griersonianum TaxID=479676 RepID=A0AAV6HN13_9ERIC|nr:hypothetical protein RHGRI_038535 [Rhododendron griersonianum]